MKMVAEYVEHALELEQLAAREENVQPKIKLETQAVAYRKLATDRAKKSGLNSPTGKQGRLS